MDKPVPPPEKYKEILHRFWEAANEARARGESPLLSFLKTAGSTNDPETLNSISQIVGEWFTPHPVLLFSKELVARRKPTSILDPNAGNGLLLGSLAQISKAKCLGLIRVSSELEKARLLDPGQEVFWRMGDPLKILDDIKEQFEAVVSNLPFGMERRALSLSQNGSAIEVNDEEGRLILLKSALKLAPNGIGAFVVSYSFFFRSNESSVRHVLGRFGLSMTGCFFHRHVRG
jgi:type I restriction-modification system DNA methylase subunit